MMDFGVEEGKALMDLQRHVHLCVARAKGAEIRELTAAEIDQLRVALLRDSGLSRDERSRLLDLRNT